MTDELCISFMNNLCIQMELTLRQTEGFEFMMNTANSRQFCLCGGDSEATKIYVVPTVVGEIDIEAVVSTS